jgi:hypothetical protein
MFELNFRLYISATTESNILQKSYFCRYLMAINERYGVSF